MEYRAQINEHGRVEIRVKQEYQNGLWLSEWKEKGRKEDHEKWNWYIWNAYVSKGKKKLASSSKKLEGMEDDRTGRRDTQQNVVLER
jgi:hypothetical protein